jgi:hypothetical protein
MKTATQLIFILVMTCCACDENEPANSVEAKVEEKLWDSSIVVKEIHLLRLKNGCDYRVYRNGAWARVSAADEHLMQSYPYWKNKGAWFDGIRCTILTRATQVHVNDTLHVIHMMEDTLRGRAVFIMGPKEIFGEVINDSLVSLPVPAGKTPWAANILDGETPPAPYVDYNFAITEYHFSKPGVYNIRWKMGNYSSNVLVIHVN